MPNIASLFRSWGFDTAIERFDVLFPTPKTRILEMTAPQKFVAKLEESSLPEDATSGQKSEQLPVYNAYSVNGDVTGELVYANYGKGLRRTGTAWNRCARQDRHRALRQFISRRQTQNRRRTRRYWLHYLFRSSRRRLLCRRRIPARRMAKRDGCATRLGCRPAALCRRPFNARHWRHTRRETARLERSRNDTHENPGAPDFLL